MRLEDVQQLSQAFKQALVSSAGKPRMLRNPRTGERHEVPPPVGPRVGLGATLGRTGTDWRLAVRAWTKRDLEHPAVSAIVQGIKRAEVDRVVTGPVRARRPSQAALPKDCAGLRGPVRPLRAGHSVGHRDVGAGTLGTFVEDRRRRRYMLSNAHVLAPFPHAARGDPIFQPGPADGPELTRVGRLAAFRPFERVGNSLDAALGSIDRGMQPDDFTIPNIGAVVGTRSVGPDLVGLDVQKTGRSTCHTVGAVKTIGLIHFAVEFPDRQVYRFDDVIEVVSKRGRARFSAPGDSGSLVLDMERRAVGLLFLGAGRRSYLNPIGHVLNTFQVALVGE